MTCSDGASMPVSGQRSKVIVMAIRWPLLVRRTHKWLALLVGVQALLWTIFVFFGASLPQGILAPFFFFLGFFGGALVISWAIAKELNPPETTGLSIALINTAAFLSVAVLTSLIGFVLDWGSALPPAEAYRNAFALQLSVAAAGFAASLFVPESFGRRAE